jgi:hypothetical protein
VSIPIPVTSECHPDFTYYGRADKISERTSYTNYEFNSKGDWIKQKQTTEESFNRRHVSMFYREIEYYYDKPSL